MKQREQHGGVLSDLWPEGTMSAASLQFGWRGWEPSLLWIKRVEFFKTHVSCSEFTFQCSNEYQKISLHVVSYRLHFKICFLITL